MREIYKVWIDLRDMPRCLFTLSYLDGLYVVSCGLAPSLFSPNDNTTVGEVLPKRDIAINGSTILVGNKLQASCDFASFEQMKRIHRAQLSTNDKIPLSTSPLTPD